MELNLYIIIILLLICSIFCGCNYSLGTSKICIASGLLYIFIIGLYWKKNNYKIEHFNTENIIGEISDFPNIGIDSEFVKIVNKDTDYVTNNVNVLLFLETIDFKVITKCVVDKLDTLSRSLITINIEDADSEPILSDSVVTSNTKIEGTNSSEYSMKCKNIISELTSKEIVSCQTNIKHNFILDANVKDQILLTVKNKCSKNISKINFK